MMFLDSVTDYSATPKVDVGTVREEGGVSYLYVYSPSAVGQYRAVVLASGVTNYTVSPVTIVPVASGDATKAVGIPQIAIPASSYFWAAQKGYVTVEQAAVSGSLSPAKLVVASTSGTVQTYDPATNGAPYIVGFSMAPLGNYSLTIPAFIDLE